MASIKTKQKALKSKPTGTKPKERSLFKEHRKDVKEIVAEFEKRIIESNYRERKATSKVVGRVLYFETDVS